MLPGERLIVGSVGSLIDSVESFRGPVDTDPAVVAVFSYVFALYVELI
jgi:hypothetical protein